MKLVFTLATLSLASAASANVTVDFSDKPLAVGAYVDDAPFVSNGVGFNNRYDPFFWRGWSYSAVSDSTTASYTNDHAAITGSGVGGSGTYAVGYYSEFEAYGPTLTLPAGERPASVQVTNVTYPYYILRDGDPNGFSKKFGGATGNDPDFFKVTFTGYDAAGLATGATDFYLADFRSANNAEDYIVNTWTNVDLSSLGEARTIALTFASSDMGAFGINTPTYVAIDNLQLVPEPTTLAAVAGAAMVGLRRRHRGGRGR